MIVISVLCWWTILYLLGIVVHSLETQLGSRLLDTLAYNESGSIRSLTWRRPNPNASSYQLVAASLDKSQVWNYSHVDGGSSEWELELLLDFFVVQPLNKTNETAVRAVSFSPNGRWLAIGGDAGLVQIWAVISNPWKLRQTLTTSDHGKIRSLSWHSNSLYLAAAGIDFGVRVWDVNHDWNVTVMEPRSPTLPPPPNDSYVHYVDWSPLPMGSTRNSFVVDTTVYAVAPVSNIFADSDPPATARATAVLDACRLCTLPQWSRDGQRIATAFGTSISISKRLQADVNATNATEERWELIRNITTVKGTYMVISAMEWSPNGRFLAVGGAGQALLFLYDSTNWTAPPVTVATFGEVDSLAWRPDGTQIAVGTDRRIELFEIQAPTSIPSPPTTINNDSNPPTPSPSMESSATPTPLTLDSGLSMASMAGIGIAAIVTSFTIVGIVFYQRMRLVTKRKRQKQELRERNETNPVGDVTASEDNFDHPSPLSMDRRIASVLCSDEDCVTPVDVDDTTKVPFL